MQVQETRDNNDPHPQRKNMGRAYQSRYPVCQYQVSVSDRYLSERIDTYVVFCFVALLTIVTIRPYFAPTTVFRERGIILLFSVKLFCIVVSSFLFYNPCPVFYHDYNQPALLIMIFQVKSIGTGISISIGNTSHVFT